MYLLLPLGSYTVPSFFMEDNVVGIFSAVCCINYVTLGVRTHRSGEWMPGVGCLLGVLDSVCFDWYLIRH